MKNLSVFLALALLGTAASAETCFKSGEQVSGMNKLCFYKCLSGTKVLNLTSIDLCPLSADFMLPFESQGAEEAPRTYRLSTFAPSGGVLVRYFESAQQSQGEHQ